MKATTARAIYEAVKDKPLPARAALDATMDEATFRGAVCDMLNAFHWRWSYIPDSRKVQGHTGIPDIIAIRYGRLLFIELKSKRGQLREQQREWIHALSAARAINDNLEVYVWRPHHMSDIERILA